MRMQCSVGDLSGWQGGTTDACHRALDLCPRIGRPRLGSERHVLVWTYEEQAVRPHASDRRPPVIWIGEITADL